MWELIIIICVIGIILYLLSGYEEIHTKEGVKLVRKNKKDQR